MDYGFVRVAAAVPRVRVADCEFNIERIGRLIHKADEKGVQFVVFPELCVTAYTCADLFHQESLLADAYLQLDRLLEETRKVSTVSIVGMPVRCSSQLFNCGVVIQNGKILGIVPKTYVPGYNEFYEERWFSPGAERYNGTLGINGQEVPFGTDLIFCDAKNDRICFGVELCEDLWVPVPPSSYQALAEATLLFNLSASNDLIAKHEYRKNLVSQQSARCIAAYVYASCGQGESTTDVVFGGHAMIAENGVVLTETGRFSDEDQLIYTDVDIERLTSDRVRNTCFMEGGGEKRYRGVAFETRETYPVKPARQIDPHPFVPSDERKREERCREIFMIQTSGLAARFEHTGIGKAVIGISGGLDSTLALLVTARTFDRLKRDRKDILAVTMPGFGTTGRTYKNAVRLMEAMKVSMMEINIKDACLKHFEDIGHDQAVHDVTYENVQARERTQILMDIANKEGGLVVGTGDLSEIALGWSTYNGDHMSMYAVNCGIPKTLVRYLVGWVADYIVESNAAEVLRDILDTPITPELLPPDGGGEINQRTEDIIGPYELHDFFLYHFARYGAGPEKILYLAGHSFRDRYSDSEIKKWLGVFIKRFFSQQFKRSCIPDGPKVGTISLSPRGDWRMPSDVSAEGWLRKIGVVQPMRKDF